VDEWVDEAVDMQFIWVGEWVDASVRGWVNGCVWGGRSDRPTLARGADDLVAEV